MNAGFEFELGKGAAAANFRDDLLVTAGAPFARRYDLDFPALLGGIAFVHPEEVAGEQGRLVTAGAGANFEDDVAFVHGVLGNERELDLSFERRAPLFERRPFGTCHVAHLRIDRRILEHGVEACELGQNRAIVLDGFHDRLEFREFARELHIGLRPDRVRKFALHRLVAGEQCVELLFWQHGSASSLNLQAVLGREGFEPLADGDAAGGAVQQWIDQRRRLAGVQFKQHGLHRPDGGRRERERTVTDRDQGERSDRLRCQLSAERDRFVVRPRSDRDVAQRAERRHSDRVEPPGDPLIAAIGSIEELEQIVGADRDEIDSLEQFVELIEQRRYFEHGADVGALRQLVTVPAQMGELALDERFCFVEFFDCRDHREHQPKVAAAGRAQERANLAAQEPRAVETEPDGAPSESRILLLDVTHIGQQLVAADVECPERHRPLAGSIEHGAVERELIGGECAYWACIPSKTLLRPAEVREEATRAAGTSTPGRRWAELVEYRDYMIRNLDDSGEVEGYEKQGVRVVKGDGCLAGPGKVQAGDETLETERVVIATGSGPHIPQIPGLHEAGHWTNREATTLTEVPQSVVVLGGGPVGIELAQFLRRFDADVALVESADLLLAREDVRVSELIADSLREDGVDLHLGTGAAERILLIMRWARGHPTDIS